jgi:hypothetical protein
VNASGCELALQAGRFERIIAAEIEGEGFSDGSKGRQGNKGFRQGA